MPPPVIRFWRELDGLLESVRPTRWGAVVTDRRFPAIWDANYARIDVEADGVTVDEVERALLPALAEVGADLEHVVAFEAETARDVLSGLSTRGHRLGWDLVMVARSIGAIDATVEAVEVDPAADATWEAIRASLAGPFGIEPGPPLEQLLVLERDVLVPAGKRRFGVAGDDGWMSFAALLVLDGVGYVDDVATHAPFRGRGLASGVTARAVREALAQDVELVFLLADADDAPTVAMYERLGFRGVAKIGSTRGPLPHEPATRDHPGLARDQSTNL